MDLDLGELSSALGREITTYKVEAIDPQLRIHSVTGGVYRVTGDGFSLVIKVVTNGSDPDPDALWVSGAEPSHRNYWKREWLAYSTGLLDALPGELRAPRTYLTTEPAEGEAWIWMEDVDGQPGTEFPVDDYDGVAFDLATTQASYPSGRGVLPTAEWMSRQWLRSWVETLGQQIGTLDDDDLWRSEELADVARLVPRTRELWKAREELLTIVETAPQTVVHLDFWPSNLIAADDGTTVAIDWSQVGIGAIAQDLDQLSLDPLWMQVTPGASVTDLEAHVVPSYLSGLRLSGFDVSEADLRRWYAAAASIRYAPMLGFFAKPTNSAEKLEARFGRPYAAIVADRGRVLERALELGESALGSSA